MQLRPEWYGWQTLIADGISLPTAVISYYELGDAGEVFLLSVTSSIVTPSIIHAAHGNWGASGISLAVRVPGALMIGYGLLEGFGWQGSEPRPLSPIFVLGAITMLTAPVIDALLAFEDPPEQPKARTWTVAPWASPRERAGGLSFAAQF